MSSHPKKVDKFIPWSKAMVAGATVDKPSYPGTSKTAQKYRKRRIRRNRRKRKNAKKEA